MVDTGSLDVAVIGLGAMGSMAAWRLARRGARVAGFDRLAPPHQAGSSHGESRITRTAYYEGAWYVPLLNESFPLWRELERESGHELLALTGAAMIGAPDGLLVSGALGSAREHGLDHELLDAGDARRRLPQHRIGDDEVALLEPAAGFLRPERCIESALRAASSYGAELRIDTDVTGIVPRDGMLAVRSGGGDVLAREVVVCAGARIGSLLTTLEPMLTVERQVMAWFDVDEPARFAPERFPVFCHEVDGTAMCYGFGSLDARTIKVAMHHDGPAVDPCAALAPVSEGELAPLVDFVTRRLRGVRPVARRSVACRYTNTTDGHFLIDRLPDEPGVIAVSACSGHGFKFSCVIGDIVADLVLDGGTRRDIGRFRFGRPSLRA